MSFRRVIFTSGQNFQSPILCQYLIYFNDFIRDFIWIITLTEKSKFEEIADLKVYGNLKTKQTHFFYEVDKLDGVDFDEKVDNELEVENTL